jgi:glycosyltransferase involved in cell wall biosynthesis
MDAVCAIDLDTILPCLYVSKWKRIPRVYDAHELFTGLKEVATRPAVKKFWTAVERKAVPQFKFGYTVSQSIADEFNNRYGVRYGVIRNVPILRDLPNKINTGNFLLYSGAVNEARAFEQLIPAMKLISCKLVVCGDGNFMDQLKELIREHAVESKVELRGMLSPAALWEVASQATIGMAIAENTGINQYLALPNKFFDYIHAGLPQVTMDFPEYRKVNSQYEVAVLIKDADPERIASAVNNLLSNSVLYDRLKHNCLQARLLLNWQEEQKLLINMYQSVFNQ